MVVDDEVVFRLALKSLANWHELGFEFNLEANNGKEALELLKSNMDVDIIFTDINMPVMDGLEFIAELKKLPIHPQVIVLSAYSDYNLVRIAFKLGIEDYIIKNAMDVDDISKMLKTLIENRITKNISKESNNINRTEDLLYLKETLLRKLLESNVEKDVKSRVTELGLAVGNRNIVIYYLIIDNFQAINEKYDNRELLTFSRTFINAVYQALTIWRSGEVLSLSPFEYVVIISFDNKSMLSIREEIIKGCGQIKYNIKNYLNVTISIGISQIRNGFENIGQSNNEAEYNARLRFLLGKGRIIFPEDAEIHVQNNQYRWVGDFSRFLQAINKTDRETVHTELEKILKDIRKNGVYKMDDVYACYIQFMYKLLNYLEEIGEDVVKVFAENINFYEKVKSFETMCEIEAWFGSIIDFILNYLEKKTDNKLDRVVYKAQEFIKANYNEDLTLKMVSDYLGLSESYFSRFFTKHTTISFSEYLISIRIDKAKQLLVKTNLKVFEVADKVGYPNIEHFSRMFKKITGYTPNNFKHSMEI